MWGPDCVDTSVILEAMYNTFLKFLASISQKDFLVVK